MSGCLFFALWFLLRHRSSFHGAEVPEGSWPDAAILGIAYSIGHFILNPWSGLPPNVSQDWLPIGVLSAASLTLLPIPKLLLWPLLVAVTVTTIGLMLDGFAIFSPERGYTFNIRLLVFLPIILAFLAAAAAQISIARRFTAPDFFILNGVLGTICALAVALGYTSEALARAIAIPAAVGGTAFFIAILCRPKHVSAQFAFLWQFIISAILAYAYFSKYQRPSALSLALLLSAPVVATPLLSATNNQWRARAIVYPAAIAAAILGFLHSNPSPPDEDSDSDPGGHGDYDY